MEDYTTQLLKKRNGKSSGISRRKFLIGLSALGALGLAWYGGKKAIGKIDQLAKPYEKVRILTANDKVPVRDYGVAHMREFPATYAEFRGTVFQLYPLDAQNGDAPEKLICKANEQYNGGIAIKGDLADRALDLFKVLQKNKLEGLVENEIKSFAFKIPPTPLIHAGKIYQIPAVTAYASLDDVLSTYKRQQ